MTRRHRLIALSVALALSGAWALIAFWVGPSEIARAHRGESLPFLNDVLADRSRIPLEEYLADWRRLAATLGWALAGVVLVGYGALEFLASAPGRRARRAVGERWARAQERAPAWPLPRALLLAVWLGLLTGLGEAVYTVIEQNHLPTVEVSFFSIGWEGLWMAPVVNAALLVALALVLHTPRLRWRRLVLDRFLVFSLAGLALFGLIRKALPGVQPIAAGLLSAGIAAQTARIFTARPERWRRFVSRSAVWGAVALAGWTIAANGARWLGERRQLAGLSQAAPDSPNVLLIILDTVRAASLSLHGYDRPTSPVLDSLAAGGATFSNALTTSSWTLPSHASMFTGRWAHELSADWDVPLDDRFPTLAEWFTERGYATGGFAANVGYVGNAFGLTRGFIHYDARPNTIGFLLGSSWLGRQLARYWKQRVRDSHQMLARVPASEIREELMSWLDGTDERPFFAFLNLFDAHAPYLPPEPFHLKFARPGARYWMGPLGMRYPQRQRQDFTDTYDSSIAYVDHELGVLMGELAASGALDNTIVVITSDHGEEFFEHGVWQHGHSLYSPSLHVPLVVLFSGRVPEQRTVDARVSLRDLPATLTELVAGAADPVFPGRSLVGFLEGSAGSAADGVGGGITADEVILSGLSSRAYLPEEYPVGPGDLESIVVGRMHYIRNLVADGREELYDLEADPWERSDLSGTEAGKLELPRLRALLDAATRGHVGAAAGREDSTSAVVLERPRAEVADSEDGS